MSNSTGIIFEERPYINTTPPTNAEDASRNNVSCTNTSMTYVKQNSRLYVASYNGTAGKIACGNIGFGRSVSFWINLDTTTESIMEESAGNGIAVSSGTLAYTAWDNAFVNAVDTNTIAATWSHVVITSTTDVTMSAFTLGLITATYLDAEMVLVTVWNREISNAEIRQLFNSQKHLLGIGV